MLTLPAFSLFLFVGNYLAAFTLQIIWFKKIFMGALKALGLGGKKAEMDKLA